MADEVPQPIDFWNELEEAELTVENWPAWQQRYEALPEPEDIAT
jgi:hypothetical protein